MHYRYNYWLSSHWETIVTMVKSVYETEENVDDVLILGQYLHRPSQDLKAEIQSQQKINKLIVYQLEPLVENHWWKTHHIINHIRYADEVWDYDLQNIEVLRKHGINAKFKPIQYSPELKRITNSNNPDIDLLFYGTFTEYRQQFIKNFTCDLIIHPGEELIAQLNFVWLYNISDHRLDEFIGRSKIVLNLPPYESDTRQQQTRIGYLLNNDKCVLSKQSPINYFGDSIIEFSDYNNLKTQLLDVIQNNKWQNPTNNFKKPKSKLAIFYHIYPNDNWRSIFEDQIVKLQLSGLYDQADYIHLGINGNLPFPYHFLKINRVQQNKNFDLESDTLHELWKFCKANPDYKVLYIHTKGVTHKDDDFSRNTTNWRNYLEDFVINKWNNCVELLDNYDCVSTEWNDFAVLGNQHLNHPHYAGNFWWANASYINKLDPIFLYENHKRWDGEFWIGTANPKYYSFYNSRKNLYDNLITKEEYQHLL